MTTMQRQVGRAQAARGAFLTGIAQAYKVGLSFVSSILLARLLTPKDFGLMAMVYTAVAFVSLIQDLGLNQAIIQRQRISHPQISALFWVTTGFSFILATFVALSAPIVAWFFRDPRLIALTAAFASLVLLSGSQSQHFALLNRELRFKTLAGIDVLTVTASTLVGVLVAWLTSSYWALFAANLAAAIVSFVCVWMVSSFRPGRPSFEGDLKEILGFGSGVSGFNIVNYLARNADNLLIGRFYGSDQLGLYDRAYRLLLFPLQQIQAPLGRVMLPTLSRLQSDPHRYRKAYTECISLIMIASQPGLLFLTVFSKDAFLLLLGPHWVAAAPIFQWLGICALHQAMSATVGWLFLSQGRGGDFFRIGSFNAFTSVVFFLVGLPWGPLGVAAAYTIGSYIVQFPVTIWSAGRRGPVSVRDLMVTALPHAIAVLTSGAILVGVAMKVQPLTASECLGLAILSYAVYGVVMLAYPQKRMMLGANVRAMLSMLPSRGGA